MWVSYSTVGCKPFYDNSQHVILCTQIGGATGFVGDPSGRTKEREGLTADSLERNKSGLRENLERIFSNGQDATDKYALR